MVFTILVALIVFAFANPIRRHGNDDYSDTVTDDGFELMIGENNIGLSTIIQQVITDYYANNTTQTKTRRNYDISSTITCTTIVNTTKGHDVLNTVCENTGSANYNEGSCFSAESQVYVEIDGPYVKVIMKDLKKHIGKKIMSMDKSSNIVGSKLISFPHINDNLKTTFFDIFTENGNKISATGNHLIYKLQNSSSQNRENRFERVFVNQLHEGDYVLVYHPNYYALVDLSNQTPTSTIIYEKITHICHNDKVGIYAPMTEDGFPFFVDNILASPYSSYNNRFTDLVYYYYSYLFATSMNNVFL